MLKREPLISHTTIYPNPTVGELRIENGELRIENVEVFDVYGRKQKAENRKQNEGSTVIDVSHLSPGIYFVRVYNEKKGIETLKLIKN
jgi:hypothetical protein